MTTRTSRAVRLLVLAFLLPASGCCTILTWEAAPEIQAAKLTGASVDDAGALALGVRMTGGHSGAYCEIPSSGQPPDDERMCFVKTRESFGGDARRFDFMPSADGKRIEVPTWRRVPARDDRPNAIVLGPHEGALEIVSADGVKLGYVDVPGTGGVNWIHPGAWLCVVATPVTVAVDVVTLPFQAIAVLFFWPRC